MYVCIYIYGSQRRWIVPSSVLKLETPAVIFVGMHRQDGALQWCVKVGCCSPHLNIVICISYTTGKRAPMGPPDMLTLVYKPWNNPHFYTSSLYLPCLATEIRQLNAIDWGPHLLSNPYFHPVIVLSSLYSHIIELYRAMIYSIIIQNYCIQSAKNSLDRWIPSESSNFVDMVSLVVSSHSS